MFLDHTENGDFVQQKGDLWRFSTAVLFALDFVARGQGPVLATTWVFWSNSKTAGFELKRAFCGPVDCLQSAFTSRVLIQAKICRILIPEHTSANREKGLGRDEKRCFFFSRAAPCLVPFFSGELYEQEKLHIYRHFEEGIDCKQSIGLDEREPWCTHLTRTPLLKRKLKLVTVTLFVQPRQRLTTRKRFSLRVLLVLHGNWEAFWMVTV